MVNDLLSLDRIPQWEPKKAKSQQPEVVEYAQFRFFEGATWEQVFNECGFPQRQWITLCPKWKKLKEQKDDEILTSIRLKAIGEHCEDLARDSLEIIARTLKALNQRDVVITDIKELEAISRIATGMWKISQVEKGKATEIRGIDVMAPRELAMFVQEKAKNFTTKHGSIIDLEIDEYDGESGIFRECEGSPDIDSEDG